MKARADLSAPASTRQRVDKWLWAARFYKTRSLAVQAIDAGHVRVEGARVKPAHDLRVGERISVRKSGFAWEVEVTALSDRRGGAADAALLYRETAQSLKARTQALQQRTMQPSPKYVNVLPHATACPMLERRCSRFGHYARSCRRRFSSACR